MGSEPGARDDIDSNDFEKTQNLILDPTH